MRKCAVKDVWDKNGAVLFALVDTRFWLPVRTIDPLSARLHRVGVGWGWGGSSQGQLLFKCYPNKNRGKKKVETHKRSKHSRVTLENTARREHLWLKWKTQISFAMQIVCLSSAFYLFHLFIFFYSRRGHFMGSEFAARRLFACLLFLADGDSLAVDR